jgi:prepilin-type N-terminal cleavage/methylation domain-containing protein
MIRFPSPPRKRTLKGFTLAELLITLAILGEIATFSIPKIITAQQSQSNNAKVKEAMATISAAYQQYAYLNGFSSNVTSNNILQYVNYVAIDTTTTIDDTPGWGQATCTSSGLLRCVTLHNGAKLMYRNNESFLGTSTTNGIWFLFDPDGRVNNTPSLCFFILYSGRVSAQGNLPAITSSHTTASVNPNPTWFSW